MTKIFFVSISSLLACAELSAAEWKRCTSSDGIAYVRADAACSSLERRSYTSANFDAEDVFAISALGEAREIIVQVGAAQPGTTLDELRDYLGREVFSCIAERGMSAVASVTPDPSNTLGQDTYRIEFKGALTHKVTLLIEPLVKDHEWVRYIE